MSHPVKCPRVCGRPSGCHFGPPERPLSPQAVIVMTLAGRSSIEIKPIALKKALKQAILIWFVGQLAHALI